MSNKKIDKLHQEYLSKYQSEAKSFDPKHLEKLIQTSIKQAELAYEELSEPKSSSIDTYTLLWVKDVLNADFIRTTLKEIRVGSKDANNQVGTILSTHLSILPLETIRLINKQIYTGKHEGRVKYWKEIALPTEKARETFVALAKARNTFAQNKGYSNYIDMRRENLGASKSDYREFLNNIDTFIKDANKHLARNKVTPSWFYSQYNLPCFICSMTTFPLKTQDEVIDFVASRHPSIHKFRNKIEIVGTQDSPSNVIYIKETDSFKISINKNGGFRHQAVDLIHELGHVVFFLDNLKNGLDPWKHGKYKIEAEVLEVASPLLEDISTELSQACLADSLLTLRKVLFEVELYRNPNQNLEKLYAKIFNRCFGRSKQESNPFYLLDEMILMKPLSNLPHAMAYVNRRS